MLGLFTAVLAVGSTLLFARNWPFTREAVTTALQDRSGRIVEIRNFRRTYFPPGCVAEEVRFLHREHQGLPPLITVRTLTIEASYAGLFNVHKRIDLVQVAGLHVRVAPIDPHRQPRGAMPLTDSNQDKSVTIGEIRSDGAVLEFMTNQTGKEPFRLTIHQLRLDHVGANGPISFNAALLNTEPPGEIRSHGQIGPWNSDDPGTTPVSGSYTFDKANLGVFQGISGTMSSSGKFTGTLQHLDSDGGVDIPNFSVTSSGHRVHLSTGFRAVVDAINGDTFLHAVEAHFRRTTLLASGGVTGQPGRLGKAVALDMTVNNGRIEDLLSLFTNEGRPSMTGSVTLRARVAVPPGPGFLQKLNLEGDFGAGGQFANAQVQSSINRLTESARGENKHQEAEDTETVVTNLKGHVVVTNGIVTLSNVSFITPGTLAELKGTYNLLDKTVDLKGVLHTNGKLSDTTSGFKALVMKAVTPFLKKKSVTIVPFTITGTSANPSFALDFDGKRRL